MQGAIGVIPRVFEEGVVTTRRLKAVEKRKSPSSKVRRRAQKENSGSVLLSHTVTHVVPSALEGLTSVFGMGTGVAPPLSPPKREKDDNFTFAAGKLKWDYGQAARPISTSKLNPLLDLHLWPINLVVYKGSLVPVFPPERDILSRGGLPA